MRLSKQKISQETQQQIFSDFYQLLADLQKEEEVKTFLEDFLTKGELLSLTKRLAIAFMLEKEYSYGEIKKKLSVSSATIASVQEMMKKKSVGFALALKRLEAEQWADKTAQKISRFFKTFS